MIFPVRSALQAITLPMVYVSIYVEMASLLLCNNVMMATLATMMGALPHAQFSQISSANKATHPRQAYATIQAKSQ